MAQPSIFTYEDYKQFVREWAKSQPSGGRGVFKKIAQHLKAHTTFVSQVFRGNRELTPEQALRLCRFLACDPGETDYFLALVDAQRTTSPDLRATIERRLQAMRHENQKIKNRMGAVRALGERETARFYSNWYYSGVRLATSIDGLQDAAAIAQRLLLPPELVQDILAFLVDHGLVTCDQERFRLGPARTHIDRTSHFAAMHHRNWRLKAIERHAQLDRDDLAFSAPMTLSCEDLTRVRQLLLDLIQETDRIVRDSPAETLAFLNLDLIKI